MFPPQAAAAVQVLILASLDARPPPSRPGPDAAGGDEYDRALPERVQATLY